MAFYYDEVFDVQGYLYSHVKQEGYKKFSYSWHHRPTQKTGKRDIWCLDANSFLKLLAIWNTENWLYCPIV